MGYAYTNKSGFKGPFVLDYDEIQYSTFDNNGVYILTDIDEGFFTDDYEVKYVGRGHLRTRLRKRIGSYTHFYYKVANNEYTRFRIECEEFHRYGKGNKLHNQIHPAKPSGDYYKCTEIGCSGESH